MPLLHPVSYAYASVIFLMAVSGQRKASQFWDKKNVKLLVTKHGSTL